MKEAAAAAATSGKMAQDTADQGAVPWQPRSPPPQRAWPAKYAEPNDVVKRICQAFLPRAPLLAGRSQAAEIRAALEPDSKYRYGGRVCAIFSQLSTHDTRAGKPWLRRHGHRIS